MEFTSKVIYSRKCVLGLISMIQNSRIYVLLPFSPLPPLFSLPSSLPTPFLPYLSPSSPLFLPPSRPLHNFGVSVKTS